VTRELVEIHDYIAKDSPQNASNMVGRLLDAMESLDQMPYRFHVAEIRGREDPRIRLLAVNPYLVIYEVDENRKAVHILRIRHSSQRPL